MLLTLLLNNTLISLHGPLNYISTRVSIKIMQKTMYPNRSYIRMSKDKILPDTFSFLS